MRRPGAAAGRPGPGRLRSSGRARARPIVVCARAGTRDGRQTGPPTSYLGPHIQRPDSSLAAADRSEHASLGAPGRRRLHTDQHTLASLRARVQLAWLLAPLLAVEL